MKKSYAAPGVTVTFDGEVCVHAAECVRGLPAVFDTAARPWIQPANATVEQVVAQVRRCPSGALQAELRAEVAQAPDGGDGQA
jgi:uncharacterized Fe-S cluster protein YjdI